MNKGALSGAMIYIIRCQWQHCLLRVQGDRDDQHYILKMKQYNINIYIGKYLSQKFCKVGTEERETLFYFKRK